MVHAFRARTVAKVVLEPRADRLIARSGGGYALRAATPCAPAVTVFRAAWVENQDRLLAAQRATWMGND